MSFIQYSRQVLRAHGYKITQPRKQVIKVLSEAKLPLSPYQIQNILQHQGEYLDHVTIYRVLDSLSRLNLAHKVLSVGGFIKCALPEESGCHRFLVCRECGDIQEFADKALCQKESEVAERLGFHAEHHLTESSGLCPRCHSR